MNENFMKEKPVFPLLVSMALPMVISMLVNSLYNIVDSFFVAQISEDAMTALSLVYPVQNFVNAVAMIAMVNRKIIREYRTQRSMTISEEENIRRKRSMTRRLPIVKITACSMVRARPCVAAQPAAFLSPAPR